MSVSTERSRQHSHQGYQLLLQQLPGSKSLLGQLHLAKMCTRGEPCHFYKQLNLCYLSNLQAWGALLQESQSKLSRITDWKDLQTCGEDAHNSHTFTYPNLQLHLLWVSCLPRLSAALHLPHALVWGGCHKTPEHFQGC